MAKSTAERVQEARDKLRAAGLRPVQVWLPDTRAPGFADEVRRQCRAIAAAEASSACGGLGSAAKSAANASKASGAT